MYGVLATKHPARPSSPLQKIPRRTANCVADRPDGEKIAGSARGIVSCELQAVSESAAGEDVMGSVCLVGKHQSRHQMADYSVGICHCPIERWRRSLPHRRHISEGTCEPQHHRPVRCHTSHSALHSLAAPTQPRSIYPLRRRPHATRSTFSRLHSERPARTCWAQEKITRVFSPISLPAALYSQALFG
jgi:hypothetical protein